MPVTSSSSGTPPVAPDDQTVALQGREHTPGRQGPDLSPAGEQAAAEQGAADSTRIPSPAEGLVAARTERRRQRMLARESSKATREPGGAGRGERARAPGPSSALIPPGRQTLRARRSAAVIGRLAAGAAAGAILGALSVPGWLIGFLVAGLVAILPTVLRLRSRST